MREHLTPDRVAAKIRMMRSQHAGSFLIAEGDTDARVWKNLTDATCHVENAFIAVFWQMKYALQTGFVEAEIEVLLAVERRG